MLHELAVDDQIVITKTDNNYIVTTADGSTTNHGLVVLVAPSVMQMSLTAQIGTEVAVVDTPLAAVTCTHSGLYIEVGDTTFFSLGAVRFAVTAIEPPPPVE
jgi:hypothetical protein